MNSCREVTTFGQGGGAVLLECFRCGEMKFEIEMIVDRGVNRGEFLQGLHVP